MEFVLSPVHILQSTLRPQGPQPGLSTQTEDEETSMSSVRIAARAASKVFVSGATGTTGSATVSALRAAGVDVIAGVHSTEKSGPLKELGAATKQLNYADVIGMAAAMRGTDRLFLVTPVTQQTEKLTASIVEAAKAAGVAHIVKLSGLDVDTKPGFTLGHWHRAAEKVIEASGLDWTFLRANAFMQNFFGDAHSIKTQGTYYSPFGSTPVNFIDARDIGEVAAKVLSTDGHAGKIYNLTGPKGITNSEVAKLLTKAAGKTITCTDISVEQLRQALMGYGMPDVEAGATAELLGVMATGTAAYTSYDVERLLGRPPHDFARFATDFSAVFR
jgi:uncharacterized protein YbjT (DUF2867 family)